MRILVHWVLAALGFLVTAHLVPGFEVESFPAALLASVVVGLLNILVWPLLVLLTLPLTIVTFGLFLFVVNALVLKLGALITPGLEIYGFWPAVLGGIVMTLIGWLVKAIFSDKRTRDF